VSGLSDRVLSTVWRFHAMQAVPRKHLPTSDGRCQRLRMHPVPGHCTVVADRLKFLLPMYGTTLRTWQLHNQREAALQCSMSTGSLLRAWCYESVLSWNIQQPHRKQFRGRLLTLRGRHIFFGYWNFRLPSLLCRVLSTKQWKPAVSCMSDEYVSRQRRGDVAGAVHALSVIHAVVTSSEQFVAPVLSTAVCTGELYPELGH
jgi:hypothetical protein